MFNQYLDFEYLEPGAMNLGESNISNFGSRPKCWSSEYLEAALGQSLIAAAILNFGEPKQGTRHCVLAKA